jgi:hypothetical protein
MTMCPVRTLGACILCWGLAVNAALGLTPERAAMEALWEGNPPESVLRRRLVSLRRDLERLEEGGRHGEADGLIPEIVSLRRRLEGDAFSETDFSFEWKVRQARRHDPNWSRDRDRGRAVALYREALALRPGDPRNIEVEHRIAALYAFYADREVGVETDPAKAAEVFAHIIETYPPTQQLWVHSHFGMASTSVMQRELGGALYWYRKILEDVDPEAMQAPLGKGAFGADKPDEARRERVIEAAGASRLRAVEKIAYVAGAMGPDEKSRQLRDIAARYRGTPVGDRAAELLLEALGVDVEAIAEGAIDGLLVGPVVAEAAPVDGPAPAERPGGTPQPRPPVPEGAREAVDRSPWRACGVGAAAAALVVCALLLVRRSRPLHLPSGSR